MASKLPPLGERSRLMRRIIWTGVIVGIVAIAAVVAFVGLSSKGGGNNDGKSSEGTPAANVTGTPGETVTVEQALGDYVKTQLGKDYAGDCTAAIMPEGQGLCSAARGDRQNRKAFLIGPNLYEFQLWVFLKKDGTAWKVESTLPVKPETVNAPGAPWPLEKGAKVVVGGTGTCLNVRAAPGIKEAAVDCIADGTVIVLEEGPVEMDGYQWWRPEGRSGWVAGDWLRYATRIRDSRTRVCHAHALIRSRDFPVSASKKLRDSSLRGVVILSDWLRYADESATPAPAAPSPTPAG